MTITIHRRVGREEAPGEESVIHTDQEGAFRLEKATDGVGMDVRVSAPGFVEGRYGERIHSPTDGAESAEIPIVLFPGGTLVGRATDAGGSPVAGARIVVVPSKPLPPDIDGPEQPGPIDPLADPAEAPGPFTGTSLSDGTYVVEGLPFDAPLWAQAELGEWKRSVVATGLRLTREEPQASLDFRFPADTRIRVRVLGPDGLPAPGARVGLSGGDSTELVRSLDSPGEFEVRIPFIGRAEVFARVDGLLEGFRELEVAEGIAQDIELRLEESLAIEGLLVDDEGEPKFGVIVGLRRADGGPGETQDITDPDEAGGPGRMYTNVEGRFRIEGLRPGAYHLTTRLGDDYRVHRKERVLAPATEVRFVLSRWATARAALRLPPLPVPPARIRTLVVGAPGGLPVDREWGDGTVEWQRLEKGEWTLQAAVEGCVPLQWTITAERGEDIDLGESVLDRGHPFEGRAVDGDGNPVAGATVRLLDPPIALGDPVRTDAEGRFSIPHLPAGPARLVIAADRYAPAPLGAVLPAPVSTVTLRTGTVVRGRVIPAEGRGLGNTTILAALAGGERPEWLPPIAVAEDGSFDARLPAGRWRFTCLGWPDGPAGPVEADLVEGGSADITLDCRK